MIDVFSLSLLVTTVEERSQSRAAAVHGLSQPAASARLARLERQFGVVLLDRGPSGSSPTLKGQLVTEWAGELLSSVRVFEAAVGALRVEAGMSLRVAASYTVAEHLLPGWLAEFTRRRPEVTSELSVANSKEVSAAVLNGRADLGFVEGATIDPRLRTLEVGTDELVVVVAPSHPWADRRSPLSARELGTARLVSREAGSGTREALEAFLTDHRSGEPPRPVLVLGSTTAVRTAVANDAGPAALSNLAVADDLERGNLVAVPVRGLDMRRRLMAVWRRGARRSDWAEALLACATRSRDL